MAWQHMLRLQCLYISVRRAHALHKKCFTQWAPYNFKEIGFNRYVKTSHTISWYRYRRANIGFAQLYANVGRSFISSQSINHIQRLYRVSIVILHSQHYDNSMPLDTRAVCY